MINIYTLNNAECTLRVYTLKNLFIIDRASLRFSISNTINLLT